MDHHSPQMVKLGLAFLVESADSILQGEDLFMRVLDFGLDESDLLLEEFLYFGVLFEFVLYCGQVYVRELFLFKIP